MMVNRMWLWGLDQSKKNLGMVMCYLRFLFWQIRPRASQSNQALLGWKQTLLGKVPKLDSFFLFFFLFFALSFSVSPFSFSRFLSLSVFLSCSCFRFLSFSLFVFSLFVVSLSLFLLFFAFSLSLELKNHGEVLLGGGKIHCPNSN